MFGGRCDKKHVTAPPRKGCVDPRLYQSRTGKGAERPLPALLAAIILQAMAFVHLALAQLKPRKGDYAGNLARLHSVFSQLDALEPRPSLLCLSETALTGYFLE